MSNNKKLALAKETYKRKKLAEYEQDFEKFALDQIKILTKDSAKGFVPFVLN